MPVLQHHNFADDRELGDSAALITGASASAAASTAASLRLQESICVAAAGPELRDAVGGRMSHEVQSTFLPGFIKSALNPLARAIAAPFTLIIGIAFTDGPVTDLLIDAVCSMIIFGVVQRSTPGLLKIIVNVIVESLVFALPPILVLTITASVAAKLKDSLTAVILRAIQNYMEKAQPTLLSGLTHALVHTLHNGIATATVHATAPPLTHALSTSLTTSLVHFYYCTYCFYYHDYCRYCTQYQSYGQIERNWWRGMYKPPPDPDPSQNLGDLANAGEMVKIG